MFNSKGDRLESLIQYVYQELSKLSNRDIKVKNKHNVVGKSGVPHNIDVYYEFDQNGITHRVIFECKNWNSRVSKEKVLALKTVIDDIPNSAGVMVAPKGFQSSAEKFAEHHGIELISGSEQSLLAIVLRCHLQVLLPDESVVGEPFYCLMAKGSNNQVDGSYVLHSDTEGNSFLILCFSRKEAKKLNSDPPSVVRGIDKRHLGVLCNYGDNLGINLSIKQFLSSEILAVEPKLIRDFFL